MLDEVERRRALSPALVQPFMRAIMEAQFPAPGKTITIKTFLPGSGTEVSDSGTPPPTPQKVTNCKKKSDKIVKNVFLFGILSINQIIC